MDFNHFLTSYMPDPSIGSKTHFKNMLDQSVLAEQLGYVAVSIPEHHLVNILMMPSPLQMAVKLATLTKKINLVLFLIINLLGGYSSVGRALEWHSRGQRFDPAYLHNEKYGTKSIIIWSKYSV